MRHPCGLLDTIPPHEAWQLASIFGRPLGSVVLIGLIFVGIPKVAFAAAAFAGPARRRPRRERDHPTVNTVRVRLHQPILALSVRQRRRAVRWRR